VYLRGLPEKADQFSAGGPAALESYAPIVNGSVKIKPLHIYMGVRFLEADSPSPYPEIERFRQQGRERLSLL
jgi:hypothetical protein